MTDRNDEFIDEAVAYAKIGFLRAGELSDRVIKELPERVKSLTTDYQKSLN